MKENVKAEIRKSLLKIERIQSSTRESLDKIERLKNHLANLEKSLLEEEKIIYNLGLKQPRRDDVVETSEQLSAKEAYNVKVQEQKKEFIDSQKEFSFENPIEKLKRMNLK